MTMLTWLASTLRAAGCAVVELDGWETRGRGPMGAVKGVILHHTAGPKTGDHPSLNLVINGRSDLPGPMSQLFLSRDGTFHVLAAGRCNHAGNGLWQGATGNMQFIGIEAENAGDGKDLWPEVQLKAYERGVAALILKLGVDPVMACGHKEYCTPRGRKVDPSFDMISFRANLEDDYAFLQNKPSDVTKVTVPTVDIRLSMLRKGDQGNSVKLLQKKLGLTEDGFFGPATEKAVKTFQAANGLTADGLVGPKTWKMLDA